MISSLLYPLLRFGYALKIKEFVFPGTDFRILQDHADNKNIEEHKDCRCDPINDTGWVCVR